MSRAESTRGRILDSTRRLLEDGDGGSLSMSTIAHAAGVSRQLLYLHFANRADLLLEVSRLVDATARTPRLQSRVDNAPDGVAALRASVAVQGLIKPKIYPVARAVERLRDTDPDAAAVWHEREQARLARCRSVVERLSAEGALRERVTPRTAAQLLWSVTSLRAWVELVVEQGWSTRAWVKHTTDLLERGLVRN